MLKKINLHTKQHKSLSIAIASIVSALTVMPGTGFAQVEPEIEEIAVTGSRIRATDGMATPTPVTAVSIEELSNFEPGGTVAEQLDALPQFFSTATAQRGSGALFSTAGGSFLNMRSLGQNRTLVLLDGQRMVPAEKRGSVNVDTFPTALIRTVDVVTGGASAAYGADALSGVTNFVLDREFQGVKVNVGTGVTEEGDGQRWNMSVAGGFQFGDRLNVIASFDTKEIDQITRLAEDLDEGWFQRWSHVTCPQYQVDQTGPRRCTMPNVTTTRSHPAGMITGTGTTLDGMVFTDDGRNVRPFNDGDLVSRSGRGTTRTVSGGIEGDYYGLLGFGGPVSGQEVVGRNWFVAADYELNDSITLRAQAVIGRSESNDAQERGHSGFGFSGGWAPTIYRENPFIPDSVAAVMDAEGVDSFRLQKRGAFAGTNEIGALEAVENTLSQESYTLGFMAVLPNGWDLSAMFTTGEAGKKSESLNDVRVDRAYLGMDAVIDPATGGIVCNVQVFNPTVEQLQAAGAASGRKNSRTDPLGQPDAPNPDGDPLESPIGLDGSVRDCVPYNQFGIGNVDPAAIAYANSHKIGVGNVEQDFAEVLLQGELYEGWGYGPVSMATGLTWREQSFTDNAQPAEVDAWGPPLNAPELGIRGIPGGYTNGSPNLHQFSTVPNISGKYDVTEFFGELQAPFWESDTGEQRVGGSVAFRSSDYNISGRIESWKMGLEIQAMEDLRFRFTKSRDVREPTFSERFDQQGGGGNVDDFQNSGPITITTVRGGNPALAPEIADTLVAGLIYEPSFLEGFRFSADWYEIDIADSIVHIGLQDIVDRCEAGDPEQCANIQRDPVSGNIARIIQKQFNLASDFIEGYDFEVQYQMEPNLFENEFESFTLRLLGGKLLDKTSTSASGSVTDQMGAYTLPELTANITARYSIGSVSLQMQGRHIGGGLLNRRWVEGVDVDDNSVASSSWWNGQIAYNSETSNGATWSVNFSVQNLFNKLPPVTPGGSTGAQGVNNQYDIYGRRYNLGVNYSF
jgi:iron complex outermembrane receptor protein